jgi:hypothetical protein
MRVLKFKDMSLVDSRAHKCLLREVLGEVWGEGHEGDEKDGISNTWSCDGFPLWGGRMRVYVPITLYLCP